MVLCSLAQLSMMELCPKFPFWLFSVGFFSPFDVCAWDADILFVVKTTVRWYFGFLNTEYGYFSLSMYLAHSSNFLPCVFKLAILKFWFCLFIGGFRSEIKLSFPIGGFSFWMSSASVVSSSDRSCDSTVTPSPPLPGGERGGHGFMFPKSSVLSCLSSLFHLG